MSQARKLANTGQQTTGVACPDCSFNLICLPHQVSSLSARQSLELCDERMMAIDRWPIVQMSQTPEQKVTCPFMGGFNVNMYYPNDTALCADSTLLMRIESECEKGEGIVFDFRQDECVPASLPRSTKQQAYCIAHWTQVNRAQ